MTEKSSTIGEELVLCKKCSVVIYTELGLVCAGPCAKAYHVSCACVRKEDLRAQSRGFMWMCGDCSHAFIEWKQSYHKSETPNDTTLHTEIAELKSQVSLIVDTLQRFIPNESFSPNMSVHHSTPVVPASIKRKPTDDNANATDHDQPELNECLYAESNDHSFSLLLSNIDNATTESDIERLVCRCLGASTGDCIRIVKLVSSRTDCRLLDYISFQVVLKWEYKDPALRVSTWPDGIKFREFRHRQRNVWKP